MTVERRLIIISIRYNACITNGIISGFTRQGQNFTRPFYK